MTTSYRLNLVGFGNVGRAFARLLLQKADDLANQYNLAFKVTGITTARHGAAIDPDGLDLEKAILLVERGTALDALSQQPAPRDTLDFIQACPADALIETTPVNHHTGQPAIAYLQAALELGMHAITANKGPVVHGYELLTSLATQKDRRFYFESAVMDGAPIFSLFRRALPAVRLLGFTGILNSTTNLILERMENGEAFDQAVAYTQSMGLAETDPSADVDGWDAAIKVAALARVLMGVPLTPQDVDRQGIRHITPEMVAQARQADQRWKLVCQARQYQNGLIARVAPERVGSDSPLYSVSGSSSFVQFQTDVLPGLGILEGDPGPETTAYGLLADLVHAVQS